MKPPTNFQVIAEKPCRPVVGDVFEFHLRDLRLLGRVLATDGRSDPTFPASSVVIFVFGPVPATWTIADRGVLHVGNAILGPVMTDGTAWRRRYFRTITNWDFHEGETPAALAFKTGPVERLSGAIVDEHYEVIDPHPGTPIGESGDTPHLAIDDFLSAMLGIPLSTSDARTGSS